MLQCGVCFSTTALYLWLVVLPDLLALLLGPSLPFPFLSTIFDDGCKKEANIGRNHNLPVDSCMCPVAGDWGEAQFAVWMKDGI